MRLIKTALWTSAALIGLALIVTAPASADQLILDDLIVDGSACIGFDCVNGEPFGFDTIRIKENNLRIRAVDTSNSASFPTNDWQITFNDTTNGGRNKFSIDDIDGGKTPFTIEANAPSHSLYVEDGGRVGFGTNVPVVDLHVKSGNTPTLRLEQDGTSGFASQTWDVAGNEANFFIRDASNGSTLPFRIFPGAPSNALTIEAGGEIGMGTTSPDNALEISKNAGVNMQITSTSATGGAGIRQDSANGVHQTQILLDQNGLLRFRALTGATGTAPLTIDTNTGFVGIQDESPGGTLDVNGTIFLSGAQIHPDFVFEPDYDLQSIDEQSAFMWENKHLPALAPANYNESGSRVIELGANTAGILEELEKAHIYIEQLHTRLEALEKAAQQE